MPGSSQSVKQGHVPGLDPDLDAEVAITVSSGTGDQMFLFSAEVPVGRRH